jgi:hypothetical protein
MRILIATSLLAASATTAVAQISGLRALKDHSQCCAIGMPSIHGNSDGSFDPAPDPVLSRRRATAPPAPNTVDAADAALALETSTPATDAPVEYPPLKSPTEKIDGHLEVGFEFLGGYDFKLTKQQAAAFAANDHSALAAVNAQIPELVRKLDGQKVLVRGFMLPMKMDGTLTTEFLLVANSMLCCYGVVPPMNQWITVKMTKGGLKPQQDVPLEIFGTFRVEPRIENGALSAIYHLEGTKQRQAK